MLLSKLISSALAGLSASGLSVYFVPKYSELNSGNIDLIYKSEDLGREEELKRFRDNRIKLLEGLENMNQKFQEAVEQLKIQRDNQHKSVTQAFEKITVEEEKLKVEYERGNKWLEEIGKISKGIYGANLRGLQLDAIIEEINYLNESLARMYGSLSSWGFALEQIVCAIDNQDQKKKCDNQELKDWLSKSSNSVSSSAQQLFLGGGALQPLRKHLDN